MKNNKFKTRIPLFLSIALFAFAGALNAQVAPEKYLVELTDKDNSSFSLDEPEAFLSQRAIERRQKQNIEIEFNDLPVSQFYLDSLSKMNLSILNTSKWFNSLVIHTTDTLMLDTLENISFIEEVHRYDEKAKATTIAKNEKDKLSISYRSPQNIIATKDYGYAANQIEMLNGHLLHELNYRGQGMHIAVIDAGFANADYINAFDSAWANGQVLGTRDFVEGGEIEFTKHYHGTAVWSIIGANIPGVLVGTAPEAKFWLLRSEDAATEYLIEEENWISAAEFADSAGVDVINTSLGYSLFDDPLHNHNYEDMNGQTARISRAAAIAASKGMICVTSAGNEGNDPWHYITAPGDADSTLTIGATNEFGDYVAFSSVGPTSDGRVKPNVVAQGYGSAFQINDEEVLLGSGTSFSSPTVAGLVACLWQAMPGLTNLELIESIERSADLYENPTDLLGFGIPDFFGALNSTKTRNVFSSNDDLRSVYPVLFNNYIYFDFYSDTNQLVVASIIDASGKMLYSEEIEMGAQKTYSHLITGLDDLQPGFYILSIRTKTKAYQTKLIKP